LAAHVSVAQDLLDLVVQAFDLMGVVLIRMVVAVVLIPLDL
jgi:hypothetical protein